MKKSINDFFATRKAEVEYRTDRTQAEFGAPQSKSFFDEAIVDMDGVVACGGCTVTPQTATNDCDTRIVSHTACDCSAFTA